MENELTKTSALTEKYTILSSPFRLLILQYLRKKNQATWTELKDYIESKSGSLNPNTLHFHLKTLINHKYVKRKTIGEKLTYDLNIKDQKILDEIDKISRED